MVVRILAVGDVCGKAGLDFLSRHLRAFKKMHNIAFTVVNGENANVVGVTPWQAEEIFDAGADVITLGNHTWSRREIQDYLDEKRGILRPANFSCMCPGRGHEIYDTSFGPVAVISLMGRYTLDSNTDNPFPVAEEILSGLDPEVKIILVDMHAEATSEKLAMGYFLDGRVSAVWGTHTHVQTSDAGVLPDGTGFICDVGMTGPAVSVLGIDPEQSISRFLGAPPRRYDPAEGSAKMECVIFDVDTVTGKCLKAEAFRVL